MEEKTRKVLFHLINTKTKGVDTYHNNGSMWLIFTDEKKWVIELTKKGTLWYNFDFFQNCFKYLSLDVVENQHYITEWVEDTIQNGVINTLYAVHRRFRPVEDTIQNGVKRTLPESIPDSFAIEDTIQNGVKHTEYGDWLDGDERFDDIIKNGIKETRLEQNITEGEIDDIIQNGINETWGYEKQPQVRVNEVINKGEKTICNNNPNKL